MLSLRSLKSHCNRVFAGRSVVVVLLCGALLMISAISSTKASAGGQAATGKFRRVTDPILNQYIVVFDDNTPTGLVTSMAGEMARVHGGNVRHIYRYALKGFSVNQMPEATAIALSLDPRVEFVEEDGEVTMADTQLNPPSWGLDRIDQTSLPVDNAYTYSQLGTGVNVYTIDSGIRFSHTTFAGRAFAGADFVGDGLNGNDCNGHGTHVSGIVGGSQYGVAKNVTLYSVRIFPCQDGADFSTAIAAVDWVKFNHVKPAIASMSLSSTLGGNTAFDKAIRKCIAAGVIFVCAAGNNNADASQYSPARITQVITVGATGNHPSPYFSDSRTLPSGPQFGSNFGSALDLFAPGTGITSAWYTSDTETQILEGTSQATPHVAGAAAQYLQTDPTACPSTVSDVLTSVATNGVVLNAGTGSPNKLLFVPTLWPTPTYYSLSLNGTSAYVNVPDAGLGVPLDITGPITLEAWIKISTNTVEQNIIRKGGITGGGYALKVMGTGKLRFVTYASASSLETITSNTSITTGAWHHVVGIFDGSQKRIYIDGTRDKFASSTFAPGTGSGNLFIGASPDGTQLLNGLVDEVRVTSDAVYSGSSFNHLAFKRLTGVAATKGLWRFDRQNARDCADIHTGTLVGGAAFSPDVP